jgi:hypothetical protein
MPAPYPIDYPINWYSRVVTDVAGTSPSYQYFLSHADRALVASGTVIVNHSSYAVSMNSRGSSVVQSTVAAYFGTSGITFPGVVGTATDQRVVFTPIPISTTTATDSHPGMQVEQFIYFTAVPTIDQAFIWALTDADGTDTQTCSIFSNTAGEWFFHLHFFRSGLGHFFSHSYQFTFQTGSWYHLAMVKVNTQGPGSHRVGLFLNGSQLDPVLGGTPSTGPLPWRDCLFANPAVGRFTLGGSFRSTTNSANGYGIWAGRMDEIRVLYDSIDGLVQTTGTSIIYSFSVPTAPYSPLDVTTTTTSLQLSLTSAALRPNVGGAVTLGTSTAGWGTTWLQGTVRLNVRDATTYIYSSSAGRLSFVAGTALDFLSTTVINGSIRLFFRDAATYINSPSSGVLAIVSSTAVNISASTLNIQAAVFMSARNFIFDTVTGVTIATATNQKLAFYGSTPIVKPSTNLLAAISSLGLVTNPRVIPTITTTSAAYTLTTADDYLICNSGTNFTVTVPLAAASRFQYMIKNINTGTVTVQVNTADTLDGAASMTLNQWQYVRILDLTVGQWLTVE